jgi:hypothetical protein
VAVFREKASTVFGPSGFERKKAAPVGTNGGGVGTGVGFGVGVGVVLEIGCVFGFLPAFFSFLHPVVQETVAKAKMSRPTGSDRMTRLSGAREEEPSFFKNKRIRQF